MRIRIVALLLFCLTALAALAAPPPGAMPAVIPVPAAAQPSAHFDAQAATDAYLALIPPDAKARSDAYFEGGYWLLLWEVLYSAALSLLILNLRWSAKMRDFAERVTRFRPLQTAIYWIEYMVLITALGFPLAYYQGYVREHQYGLATQTFGPWMRDQMMELLVDVILGALVTMLLFGVVRKLPRTWWIWGILGVAIPFAIGGWSGLLWGGLVRICLTHHVTWSVNSICHTFGGRPYVTKDASRNNWLVGLLAFGEGWHNNHHAFPRSAFHGMEWWQFDLSSWLIRGMEATNLVWNVHRIKPDEKRKRAAGLSLQSDTAEF